MSEDWYGDGWDDGGWEHHSQTRHGGNGRGWIGIVIVVLLVAALGVFLWLSLNNSPERAAQNWLKAVTQMDSRRVSANTCTNVPGNQQTGDQMGAMLINFLQDSDGLMQSLGSVIDTEAVLEKIEIDIREVRFTTISKDENRALVRVSGSLSLRYQVISLPVTLDEVWQMSRESGRWKWCGR